MLSSTAPPIEILESANRLHYRNRIQLHYHFASSSLGFKEKMGKSILCVPNCLIMEASVEEKYHWLVLNWKKEILRSGYPKVGHVEIYKYQDQVQVTWNKPYAEQGFSQVNTHTNNMMTDQLHQYLKTRSKSILDLFGGAGNLTNSLKESGCTRQCIDLYSDERRTDEFFHLDLFEEESLEVFKKENKESFDTLILDPPRSGFKQLSSWTKHFSPKHLAYVSCHPATMIRDLKPLMNDYLIKKNYLVDLFPGTFHYEAMIFLEKA